MAITRISQRSNAMSKAIGVGRGSTMPLEWMGPPAWRLPSGKALAEFALQAGFLAPLLLGDGPFWRKQRITTERGVSLRRHLPESGNGLR